MYLGIYGNYICVLLHNDAVKWKRKEKMLRTKEIKQGPFWPNGPAIFSRPSWSDGSDRVAIVYNLRLHPYPKPNPNFCSPPPAHYSPRPPPPACSLPLRGEAERIGGGPAAMVRRSCPLGRWQGRAAVASLSEPGLGWGEASSLPIGAGTRWGGAPWGGSRGGWVRDWGQDAPFPLDSDSCATHLSPPRRLPPPPP